MRRSPDEYLARPTRRGLSGHSAHENTPAVHGIALGAIVAEDTPPALRASRPQHDPVGIACQYFYSLFLLFRLAEHDEPVVIFVPSKLPDQSRRFASQA